ncbi:hypothetical protein AVEN_143766-1 [Araneus ventricosus]|uniref:Uncharacterized protein n=1 Tax=Araneus ventricosus TaxID=182803 RepID=A0A4Y2ANP2_ARAVE|nr:hypothetical protein AVEN_143766-1 [Araneus ventricosus]
MFSLRVPLSEGSSHPPRVMRESHCRINCHSGVQVIHVFPARSGWIGVTRLLLTLLTLDVEALARTSCKRIALSFYVSLVLDIEALIRAVDEAPFFQVFLRQANFFSC